MQVSRKFLKCVYRVGLLGTLIPVGILLLGQIIETPVVQADAAWDAAQTSCNAQKGLWTPRFGVNPDNKVELWHCVDPNDPDRELSAGEVAPVVPSNPTGERVPTAPDEPNQGPGIIGGAFELILDGLAEVIYIVMVGIGTGVAYIGALFFSIAVSASINSSAYALDFLSSGWTTVRDLANLAFIFILIFIALTIMLRSENPGTMKMLARVIVIALLINFSFFLTRVVIDGGNILAVEFYNKIAIERTVGGTVGQSNYAGDAVAKILGPSAGQKDLTFSIISAIGLTTVFSSPSFNKFNAEVGSAPVTLSFIYIVTGVTLMLLGFVFFVIGIKFLVRIVVLWLAIVVAPLAFIMNAIPNKSLQGYFKQWLHALVVYSLYPAIFLFLFYILTLFTNELGGVGTVLSSIVEGNAQAQGDGIAYYANVFANIALRLGLIIVFLTLLLKASEKISALGGSIAGTVAGYPEQWMRRRGARLGGFAFQQTAGRAGVAASRSLATGRMGAFLYNRGGRAGYWVGDKLRRYTVQPLAGASVGGARPATQLVRDREIQQKERQAGLWQIQNKNEVRRLGDLEDKERTGTPLTPAEETERSKIADRVSRFGKSDLEVFKSGELERIVRVLKEGQIKNIKESDKYSSTAIEKLENQWHERSTDAPLKKANEQINLLRKINETLQASARPITVTEIHRRIGTASTPSHDVIDSTAIDEMKTDINKEIAKVRSGIAATPRGATTVELQQNLHNLQEAIREVDKLKEETKKVPQESGGVNKAGTFDTSKVK